MCLYLRSVKMLFYFFFFFQAEDGIRDLYVTGVQTCALLVAIYKNSERLVGQVARRQQVTNPKNTIYEVKRLIGRNFNDKEVQRDLKLMGYEIVQSGNGVK